jgi:hypothetical protein
MTGATVPNSTPRSAGGSVALLWLSAAAVIAFTLSIPTAFRVYGDNGYMAFALATGLVALAATRLAERAPAAHALWLIVAVAILLRGILLVMEPLLSTDIYRYVWDGRVQGAGINPYRYFPAADALLSLRDTEIFPRINRADYAPTIYPPVAQFFFFVATRLGESVTVMKMALLACEAVTVGLTIVLLRRIGRPTARIVAYLWHPLPLWEIANNGHVDALMVALMVLGLWLGVSGRPLRGAAAIALGALAKPLAAIALAVIWRPRDWRLPLVVVTILVLCYIPYLSAGWGVFGFLTQGYLAEEAISSGDSIWPLAAWRWVFATWHGDVIVYFAVGASSVAAMALHAAFRSQQSIAVQLASINNLLLLALFVVSPNYPWYFVGATPFVALVGGAPAWALTLGALLLQEEAGWGQFTPLLIRKSVMYVAFIAACAAWYWQLRSDGSQRTIR